MAEEVGDLCRQYVSANAANYSDLAEDAAVAALVKGVEFDLEDRGWSASDYDVNVLQMVRDQLRKLRALD